VTLFMKVADKMDIEKKILIRINLGIKSLSLSKYPFEAFRADYVFYTICAALF
jgi:hypothetical protein